jgi:hypothetical protein
VFSRIPRSAWLILFAACNLIFWVGVALGVGLAVSDTVDLGVETLLRQRQATAAAFAEHVVSGARGTEVAVPVLSPVPTMMEVRPTQIELDAVKTTIAEAVRPTATGAQTPVSTSASATDVVSTAVLAPLFTPDPSPTPVPPTATATQDTIKTPLLLADQGFGTLAGLDTEMNRSATGRPVLVRYSETTLNEELAALLANSSDIPYRNVYVDLKPDQVILTGDVEVMGFDVSTTALGTIVAEECRPYIQVTSVSIGGVLTPGFMEDQIEELMLQALDWYPADYPLCIDQIVIEEERATVYGHKR